MSKYIIIIFLFNLSIEVSYGQVRTGNSSAGNVDTSYSLVPDFYSISGTTSRDTSFIFRCYDRRDSLIKVVADYDQVRYYSEFKEYTDSTKTYRDANGAKQFLPVSIIVRRYDKIGKDKWICIGYPGNKYTELREDRNDIVFQTFVLIDKNNDGKEDHVRVLNHYKTNAISQ